MEMVTAMVLYLYKIHTGGSEIAFGDISKFSRNIVCRRSAKQLNTGSEWWVGVVGCCRLDAWMVRRVCHLLIIIFFFFWTINRIINSIRVCCCCWRQQVTSSRRPAGLTFRRCVVLYRYIKRNIHLSHNTNKHSPRWVRLLLALLLIVKMIIIHPIK